MGLVHGPIVKCALPTGQWFRGARSGEWESDGGGLRRTVGCEWVGERTDGVEQARPHTQRVPPAGFSTLPPRRGSSAAARLPPTESHHALPHTQDALPLPPLAASLATFILRFGNTFLGTAQWLAWAQFMGVQ